MKLPIIALSLVSWCAGACGKPAVAGTMREADVIRTVETYGHAVAQHVGDAQMEKAKASAAACEGKQGEYASDVFYVQGAYRLSLPAERQLTTLAALGGELEKEGYQVKKARTFPSGNGGELELLHASDGYSVTFTSTQPPNALALLVYSPCYKRAPSE